VGIDLGTTYSVVAHLDRHGRPATIPNAEGEPLTPSVVLMDEGGAVVVGTQARLALAAEPGNVADGVKRDMGAGTYHRPVCGRRLSPRILSAFILRRLRADAERRLGPLAGAVITVPAYFDEPRRAATAEAGRLAGLNVLGVLNEPTAAALAYAHEEGLLDAAVPAAAAGDADARAPAPAPDDGGRPLRLLVYDLGGGTFDVTIVELSPGRVRAMATEGDVRLGGRDWDGHLADLAAARAAAAHGADPRERPDTLHELLAAAEAAKRTLSARPRADLRFRDGAAPRRVEVTRDEFERATAGLLGRTRATTQIVLREAGLDWSGIDRVLLVGGATRMPMVARMLRELSGRAPVQCLAPDEAVAHGAALYADLLASAAAGAPPAFELTDVSSHSLGVAGVDPRGGRPRNRVLIPKNTPLPREAIGRFKTARAGQRSVRIRVLEGEAADPDACTEVGRCVIRDLPPGLPAGWPVEIRYAYAADGRLRVAARLLGADARVEAEFVRDNALPEGDLLLWGRRLDDAARRMDW
jgi:molecular chaperone DnaK